MNWLRWEKCNQCDGCIWADGTDAAHSYGVGGWVGARGTDAVYSDGAGGWVGARGADAAYSAGVRGWVGAHGMDTAHSNSAGGWVRGDVANVSSECAKYWIGCAGEVNPDGPGKMMYMYQNMV